MTGLSSGAIAAPMAVGGFGAGMAVLLVPVLLMAAAVVWTLPGRPVRAVPRRAVPGHDGGRSGGVLPGRHDGVAPGGRDQAPAAAGPDGSRVQRWWHPGRRRRGRDAGVDLGAVLTEVSARLQAGEPPAQAWQRTLPGAQGRAVVADDGVPVALQELLDSRPAAGRSGQQRLALAHQVAGAQVACRMAHTVGAPLAEVLAASAAGVAEAGRAQADRRAALAAPRATARLLGWLPLAALVLGSAWGAAPVQMLLDGGWGTACLVAGGVLMIAGHMWSGRLVRSAERAGT